MSAYAFFFVFCVFYCIHASSRLLLVTLVLTKVVIHIQKEEMHQTEMKKMIETAISQLDDIVGSPLMSSLSY